MATVTEKSEVTRLKRLFKEISPKHQKLVEGLIVQAARLRVRLDALNADIEEHGMTELFQQSEKCEPYERERPAASMFVKLDKNYQAIMRQLTDLLPVEAPETKESKLALLAKED